MGILFKIIVILGLIFLISNIFTKSRAERVKRRTRMTNTLLLVLVLLLAVFIVMNLYSRFGS